MRPHSLLQNCSFDFVLKGRGFKPRRKCHKINPALAAEAARQTAMRLFQKSVQPLSGSAIEPLSDKNKGSGNRRPP
jgi:hypothetical protein